jgi:hypothetical protein
LKKINIDIREAPRIKNGNSFFQEGKKSGRA